MDERALLERLTLHPMSGWTKPLAAPLPNLRAAGRLLWCGIGGSLLPSDALLGALGNPNFQRRFVPLASPEPVDLGLEPSDQVVFASKSGRTLELWSWIGRLRAMEGWKQLSQAPIVITQEDENPLALWARAEGFPMLPIPGNVGGRYSAFTSIGMLPLAWMGLDTGAFLKGASLASDEVQEHRGVWGERVWEMVDAWHRGWLRGTDEWVLLPYANRLEKVGAWWVQLVAESLGKQNPAGVRRGIIPIRAIGPQDQHAQLQRWLDGPRNVGVTLVTVANGERVDPTRTPDQCPFPGLDKWSGAGILRAQAEGTRDALEAAGVPVVHWGLNALDEAEMGSFLMAWQLIVALVGLTLEVDPFDQPAVEAGKRRTLNKLGAIAG